MYSILINYELRIANCELRMIELLKQSILSLPKYGSV